MIPRRTAVFLGLNLAFLLFNLYLILSSPHDPATLTPADPQTHPSPRQAPDTQGEERARAGRAGRAEYEMGNFGKAREGYEVETFRTTYLVNCKAIIDGKVREEHR
jgi:hypothetical protein